jgi:hypothetical protein
MINIRKKFSFEVNKVGNLKNKKKNKDNKYKRSKDKFV